MSNAAVNEDEQWAPVSDLMAALMLIFMFIAILFIRTIVQQEEVYQEECDKLYRVLDIEFRDDFVNWQVDLLRDLTIRFRNPEILFLSGKSDISVRFEGILADFYPRYINSIAPYKEDILEIRIEGHTSSVFEAAQTRDEKYIENMKLSQNRAREILKYVLTLPSEDPLVGWVAHKRWAMSRTTANGLSSSKLRYKHNAHGDFEDPEASRRVEFRLLASSCQKAGRYDEQEVNYD